jgi:hypothetical protein
VGSLTYCAEHVRAYDAQRAIVYIVLVNPVIQMIRKKKGTKIISVFEQNGLIIK